MFRKEVEVAQLSKENVLIAQLIGSDFGIEVVLGEPYKGSFFLWQENKITIDPIALQEEPIVVKQEIAHEGGHRAISRGHFIPDEIWQEFGFSSLLNTIEDCRVGNWLQDKYLGVRGWQDAVLEETLDEAGGRIVSSEAMEVFERLGYLPKFTQYLFEVAHFWRRGGFSADLPGDVRRALRETIAPVKECFQMCPSIFPEEAEIEEKARAEYVDVRTKIWPVFKELLEEDLENEALRQMIKELAEQEGKKSKRHPNEEDRGNQELNNLRRLLRETRRQERRRKSRKGGQSPLGKLREELAAFLRGERDALDKLDPGEFSRDLKERWREKFESLPSWEKRRLQEEAAATFEKLEDTLNLQMRGKLNNPRTQETHAEAKRRKEKEEEEASWMKDAKGRVQASLRRQKKEIPKDTYGRYYQEVRPLIQKTVGELEDVLRPNRLLRFHGEFPDGIRANMLQAMQFEADPARYNRLWQRKNLPQRRDYRFYLLVDLSNTMQKERKIEETVKGVVFLTEVLDRLSVPLEIAGFTTMPDEDDREQPVFWLYKRFNEGINTGVKKSIGKMLADGRGNTPTAEATSLAIDRLRRNSCQENFLITLTDGLPDMFNDGDVDGEGEKERTRLLLRQVQEKGWLRMIAIKLGRDSRGNDFIRENYPASLILEQASELSGTLANLIEEILLANSRRY